MHIACLALWNIAVNYSMVVDQSDYSICTILYNNSNYPMPSLELAIILCILHYKYQHVVPY